MLTITERLTTPEPATDRLVLPFEQRQKSRLRCRLSSGTEVGVVLERGSLLRGGDLLRSTDGGVVEVVAAPETVSVVRSDEPLSLARAAYHLGNRHVALQIGKGWLRYLHDHVLDDMLHGLGFTVTVESQPFEPEGGAYSQTGSSPADHHHSHAGHGHGHGHHHP